MRIAIQFLLLFLLLITAAFAAAKNCSAVITNGDCTLTIDRETPSTPLPIRLYSNSTLLIQVSKRPLEKIQFDVSFADVAQQDPFLAVIQAFVPNLKQVTISAIVKASDEAGVITELQTVSDNQAVIRKTLSEIKTQVDLASKNLKALQQTTAGAWTLDVFKQKRDEVLCDIEASGTGTGDKDKLYSCIPAKTGAISQVIPAALLKANDDLLADALKKFESLTHPSAGLVENLNSISTNESQLDDSLKSLQTAQSSLVQAASVLEGIDPSNLKLMDTKAITVKLTGSNRTATVKMSAQDLISNSSTALATVSATWGSTRFESSAGLLISALDNRSFQTAPIIVNGAPVLDSSSKITTKVTESIGRPTVVPIALAHYRLAEWSHSEQRFAVLLTGGTGVNPYSSSADFCAGLTFAYRSIMLTPMAHFGRDIRLTNGLYLGEPLGSSPPALSTQRYWVGKFAVGLTYRIPIN